ncbi:hypothetical protein B0A50_01228 [Salinomyces thailandicus]|uniref:A1 cistron-splicing factor AAR2 n=1 Tax=Salinomyces thailandicus TaxID=706561 RepID=A0A4U0U9G2_9PEZI|nr:hypothetical protein B0A50_01228 [Salinomyces thailandica]
METTDSTALLLLDLPENALAGIDLFTFTTTPRFKGVKGLPPGYHFTFVGSSTAFSERHGLWYKIADTAGTSAPPLYIARWETANETLVRETAEVEVLRWRANLGGIWREGLTPYSQSTISTESDEPQEEFVNWPKLTMHVTDRLLSRITGDSWSLSSASSARRDLEQIPGLSNEDLGLQADTELSFLPIDLKQTWREGATGRERTDAAQDRTWALNNIIEQHCGNSNLLEIVGELQFCFLMIITINNFSCLEQWRRISTLLFTCRAAVATKSEIFVQAIKALTLQLQHCKLAESGLIDLADEGGSLLKDLLARFRRSLQGLSGIAVQAVEDELDDLEDYLRTEHGWQFGGTFAKSGVLELEDGEQVRMDTTAYDEDDESGEYAPQIVDLTPDMARLLQVAGAEGLHRGLEKASLHEVESSTEDDEVAEKVNNGQGLHQEQESSGEEETMGDLDEMDMRF